MPEIAIRPAPNHRRSLRQRLGALVADLLYRWWASYPLRWWSPEAKTNRARYRYREEIYLALLLDGCDSDAAKDLIDDAFLRLHREYQAGRSITDPRRFAIEFARRHADRA
jgi:hypothetical protein